MGEERRGGVDRRGLVPAPRELFSSQSRAAFYEMLGEIRTADTDRELMIHMERYLAAQREWRAMFTLVESETLRKFREFREQADLEHAEVQGGIQHIEPREEKG